ncbi:metallophosphoesterase [Megamonas hypermegale]|uniref:metallophosphoesterase family protein n=1 Tax=Megamonas hypermegale TaxID=158847 RepID=UPI0026ED9744|nr:metallophosphoesterase [Megamonas hypermegale]
MKLGIMSDSHYNLDAIDDAVCLADDVDVWFHAGDSIEDAQYLEKVSGKKVYAVAGNVDWTADGPDSILVDISGIRIFMTHGHAYNVKTGLEYLNEQAEDVNADLIIYGHSHVGLKKTIGNRLFVNPGSVSEPRDGLFPSFMTATIENGQIRIKRIFIK